MNKHCILCKSLRLSSLKRIYLVIAIILVFMLESCGGYQVRLINSNDEALRDRDIERVVNQQKELERQVIALSGLKEAYKDEKKAVSSFEKKLAVVEDRFSSISKDMSQGSVDIAIIRRGMDQQERQFLELRESASEIKEAGLKNRLHIKEYQDEAVSLRGDLMALTEIIGEINESLKKLTSLEENVEGVSSSNKASERLIRKSVAKINENSKAVKSLSGLLKELGQKVAERLEVQNKVLGELGDHISRLDTALQVQGAEIKSIASKLKPGQSAVETPGTPDVESDPGEPPSVDNKKQEPASLSVVNDPVSPLLKGHSSALAEEELYKKANDSYLKGDYKSAHLDFNAFLKEYPDSALKIDALYKSGLSLFEEKDFDKALEIFDRIALDTQNNEMVPTALLRKSIIFLELGEPNRAEEILREVIERYPYKQEAESAKNILTKMRQDQ